MSRDRDVSRNSATEGNLPWYREVSGDGWRVLLAAGLGWLFEIYDIFILSLTIPAFLVYFDATIAEAGLVGSVTAAGLIIGGIINGWVADRIGRVNALFLAILIYGAFTGLTIFAPSILWVGILRFLAGLGMGGGWTAGAALVAETWPARHRGKGGAIMQAGLPIGSLLAIGVTALITHLTGGLDSGGWRWLYGLGSLPILLAIWVKLSVPESPIWQRGAAQRQRDTGALVGLRSELTGLVTRGNWYPLVLALIFVFFAQYIYWAVFTFAPTFLTDVKSLAFADSLTFILSQQLGSLIGFVVFGALVDTWGRKPTFLAFIVVGGIAMALFVFLTERNLLLTVSFFAGLGITGIFAGLGPWAAEMMASSESRGLGMGLIYNGGRIGGSIAPLVVGLLAATAGGFQAAMFSTVIAFVLAAIVMLITRETKGKELT